MNCPDYFPQITQMNTDEHRFLFTNTNQSNRTNLFVPLRAEIPENLFYNLRLFEPEIFLSRQAPKIF